MNRRSGAFKLIALVLLYVAFVGMCLTVYQYTSFDREVGFLAFKQAMVSSAAWRTVFYVHVFTCFLCLLAGITQFSDHIRREYITLHRVAGRIYVYNIVLVNFPVGLILAVYANGGIPGKIAFLLMDALWMYFTLCGVYWIKKGNRDKHERFMMRSYALTLTALTLRLLKYLMSRYSDWSYDSVYIFDAWAALLLNLLIVEVLIYRRFHR